MPLIKRKHATVKAYIHDWLEPDLPGGINFFPGLIILLVMISLASLALETEATRADTPLPASLILFDEPNFYLAVGTRDPRGQCRSVDVRRLRWTTRRG